MEILTDTGLFFKWPFITKTFSSIFKNSQFQGLYFLFKFFEMLHFWAKLWSDGVGDSFIRLAMTKSSKTYGNKTWIADLKLIPEFLILT